MTTNIDTAADVPAGEAWLVEFYGEKRPAVKDGDDSAPWNAINTGGRLSCVRNEGVTLITRLVPAPRDITSPDDVKPGEAWLVECRGEQRNAVKDGDDSTPWNTVTAGGLFFHEENDDVILIARLVPAHYNERNQ